MEKNPTHLLTYILGVLLSYKLFDVLLFDVLAFWNLLIDTNNYFHIFIVDLIISTFITPNNNRKNYSIFPNIVYVYTFHM